MDRYRPDRARVVRALERSGVVVVMNADHIRSARDMVVTVEEVHRAGYVPEVTFRIDAGILREGMFELRRKRAEAASRGEDYVLGVGSIIDGDELREAVSLGFDLLVGPGNMTTGGVEPALALKELQEAGIAVAPAVFTPSELQYMLCNRFGFTPDVIKVFPARSHGPEGISDLLAPYARPRHRGRLLMPTGAVNLETGPQYIAAIRKRGFTPVLGMSSPLALVKEKGEPGNRDLVATSLARFKERFVAAVSES